MGRYTRKSSDNLEVSRKETAGQEIGQGEARVDWAQGPSGEAGWSKADKGPQSHPEKMPRKEYFASS